MIIAYLISKSAVQYMKYFIHHFTLIPHGLIRTHKWPAPNVSGFIAQLVRASHRYREVTGSNPVEVLTFSGFYTQWLKLCLCDDSTKKVIRGWETSKTEKNIKKQNINDNKMSPNEASHCLFWRSVTYLRYLFFVFAFFLGKTLDLIGQLSKPYAKAPAGLP